MCTNIVSSCSLQLTAGVKFGPWHLGFGAYAGQSSSGFAAPPYVQGQSSSEFTAPPYFQGQSSSGYARTPYVQGQSSSVQPKLQASYPQSGFLAFVVDEFFGGVPQVGMAHHGDMYTYQTLLQSQPTSPPPPQRSPYHLQTDTLSPDQWTYSAVHAWRKTRPHTWTQPQQAESSGSDE